MLKTFLTSTRAHRPRLSWALIALFAGYAAFLSFHLEAWAGGSDSSGYMNQARFLADGKIHVPQKIPAALNPEPFDWFTFIPLGFHPLPATKEMAPSYPVGLPLILVGLAQVAGWNAAPPLAMLLSALLGVALMIPLGRLAGLPRGWSWFGAFLLAASPLYTAMSLQLFSDVPATTAALGTIIFAWRSRSHGRSALAAGALFALAVLIRPSNAVLILPVAVCLGRNWRRWIWLGAGGLPGAAFQGVYNLQAYGGVLKSGYGSVGSLFSSEFLPGILLHYAKWLPFLLTPIGLLIFALPWCARDRRRAAAVLMTWFLGVLGFYATYKHTSDAWWYLRFVLPAFPPAIVGGLWVAHVAWTRLPATSFVQPRSRRLALLLIAVIFAHSVLWHNFLGAARAGRGEAMYHGALAWAGSHLPANAVLISMQCTGALAYQGRFEIVRWDLLTPARFDLVTQACAKAGQPVYAMLFDHEENDALNVRAPGGWKKIGEHQLISFWQWSPVPAA